MKAPSCLQLLLPVVLSMSVLCLVIFLLHPNMILYISEKQGMLKICNRAAITLPAIPLNDCTSMAIGDYRQGTEVIKRDAEISAECYSAITNWLSRPHETAMQSQSDFMPDFRISMRGNTSSGTSIRPLITILDHFAIIYDCGTNQFLRLLTPSDWGVIHALTHEFQ